jgi:hypothetical protein
MLYQYNQGYKSLLQYMIRDRKSQDKKSQHKILHRSLSIGQKVTMNNFVK